MSERRTTSGLAVVERTGERTPPASSGGDAPLPYLLVHGSMDRASSFRRLAARLPEADLVSYDRRGYAGSADVAVSVDLADQVDDLLEVLAGRPVVALGHSFGGDVVLAAASAHPEVVRAAVVWEPPMPWLPEWPVATPGGLAARAGEDPADVAEAFVRRLLGDRVWERLPPATRRARRAEGAALIAEMRALRAGVPWDASAVGVPVIVGTGGASRPHQQRAAGQLAELLPDAELVVVPDADHGAHLSAPAPLADLLRRAAARAATVGAAVGTGARDGAALVTRPPAEEPPP